MKYVEKAEDLRKKGFFKESLSLWSKIYRKAIKDKNPSLTLDALIALADLERIRGKFDSSIEHYNEAVELSEVLENDLSRADSLSGLALCHKAKGNWKEGLSLIRKSRKIYEKNKDIKGIAFTFWAEGTVWRVGGRIKKSLESFQTALQIFKRLRYLSATGYTYCGLGGSSRIAGYFSASLNFYKKANQIFQKTEDRFGTAYSYCGIGNAYRMLSDLNRAEDNFKKALALYKEVGDTVSSSYTLWSLAMNSLMMEFNGENSKSFQLPMNYLMLAEKNFKKCSDPRGLIYCNITKAMIYHLKGKKNMSKELLLRASELAKQYDFLIERKYAMGLLNGKYTVPCNIP